MIETFGEADTITFNSQLSTFNCAASLHRETIVYATNLSVDIVGALCERPRAIEDRPYKIVGKADTLIFNFQLSIFN